MNIRRVVIVVATAALIPLAAVAEVYLPGTQAEENDIVIAKIKLCKSCHSKTDNGDADPFYSWQSGMMSHAVLDPVYRAAQTIANQDIPGVGEYCIRCHSPSGWLEGRSKATDGSALTTHDYSSVSCEACHRLVDPSSAEAETVVRDVPPGYGNGMMVLGTNRLVRGPYDDSPMVKSHKTVKSDFHSQSELCGTCHDVSNPLAAKDIKTQPPHTYGPMERTYSEWLLSDYAKGPDKQSCQSCHYPLIQGGGFPARKKGLKRRSYFREHGPTGSSTWVQKAMVALWKDVDFDTDAIEHGIKQAREFLKTSAEMEISFPAKGKAELRITNLTGHKLPTGYFEGRRMWAQIRFLDKDGNLLKMTGRYEECDRQLDGKAVRVQTLVDPEDTRVYECLHAISDEQAKKYNVKPGKSLHFVLNDYIQKDNRIPPKGFRNEAFTERGCQVVAYEYKDGQYWDIQKLDLPKGCASVEARLLFESVSWDYIKFLYEENKTDDWGRNLYDIWNKTGQCPPEEIAKVSAEVQ